MREAIILHGQSAGVAHYCMPEVSCTRRSHGFTLGIAQVLQREVLAGHACLQLQMSATLNGKGWHMDILLGSGLEPNTISELKILISRSKCLARSTWKGVPGPKQPNEFWSRMRQIWLPEASVTSRL